VKWLILELINTIKTHGDHLNPSPRNLRAGRESARRSWAARRIFRRRRHLKDLTEYGERQGRHLTEQVRVIVKVVTRSRRRSEANLTGLPR